MTTRRVSRRASMRSTLRATLRRTPALTRWSDATASRAMTVIGLILQDGEELGVKAVSGFEGGACIVAVGDGMDPYAPHTAGRGFDDFEDGAIVGGELLTGLGDGLRE